MLTSARKPPPANIAMCSIEAPARKNITIPISAIAMNVPRSGSAMSRNPIPPITTENGNSPNESRLMSRPSDVSQAARYTTIASLANSEGWSGGNPPNCSQRLAPFCS